MFLMLAAASQEAPYLKSTEQLVQELLKDMRIPQIKCERSEKLLEDLQSYLKQNNTYEIKLDLLGENRKGSSFYEKTTKCYEKTKKFRKAMHSFFQHALFAILPTDTYAQRQQKKIWPYIQEMKKQWTPTKIEIMLNIQYQMLDILGEDQLKEIIKSPEEIKTIAQKYSDNDSIMNQAKVPAVYITLGRFAVSICDFSYVQLTRNFPTNSQETINAINKDHQQLKIQELNLIKNIHILERAHLAQLNCNRMVNELYTAINVFEGKIVEQYIILILLGLIPFEQNISTLPCLKKCAEKMQKIGHIFQENNKLLKTIKSQQDIEKAHKQFQNLTAQLNKYPKMFHTLIQWFEDTAYEIDHFNCPKNVYNYLHYWTLEDKKIEDERLHRQTKIREIITKPVEKDLDKTQPKSETSKMAERGYKRLLKTKDKEERIKCLEETISSIEESLKNPTNQLQKLKNKFDKELAVIDMKIAEVENKKVPIAQMGKTLAPFLEALNINDHNFKRKKGSHQSFADEVLNPISENVEEVSFVVAPHTNQDRIDISTQARSIADKLKFQIQQRYDALKKLLEKEIEAKKAELNAIQAELAKIKK